MLLLSAIINIGADAEVKPINEKQYISFRGASTEKVNEQEQTTWISVLCSYNPNILPFLKKGQQVFVSGRMKADIYQGQQNFGIDISVFAQTLQLCGSKKNEHGIAPLSTPNPSKPSTSLPSDTPLSPSNSQNIPQEQEEDLPF